MSEERFCSYYTDSLQTNAAPVTVQVRQSSRPTCRSRARQYTILVKGTRQAAVEEGARVATATTTVATVVVVALPAKIDEVDLLRHLQVG